MSETKLHIVENESGAEGVHAAEEDVFVVESALQEVPAREFERLFRSILEADFDRVAGLPLYGVVRIHLAFLFAQNQTAPMALPHLIVLSRLLDEEVQASDYDVLCCHELAENYQAVVTDVASDHRLTVENAAQFGDRRSIVGFCWGLYGYLKLLVGQLFGLGWKQTQRGPEPTETVFVPHVNRFECMQPVIDRFDGDHEVVLPMPAVSWLRHREDRYATLDEYDPVPLDYFATPGRVIETLRRGIGLAWAVLGRRSFDTAVQSFVTDEFGVELPNTTAYLLGNLYSKHVPGLANTVVAEQMVAELDPDQLAIGSLGSRQQAMLYAAIDAGVDTYHVPHSCTNGYEKTPPAETVHLVPGDHVVDHLADSAQISSTKSLLPAGRPKITELANAEVTPAEWESDAIRVVVATQPFPDPIRRRFVELTLDALERAPEPVEVVVKIHPNEHPSFYKPSVENRPFPARVETDDILGYTAGADLVVTINSNVGLESMVLDTPCVCVNVWGPLIKARPYATAGPVPVLRTDEEATDFFGSLTAERVDELAETESAFVGEYYLDGDATSRVAGVIEADDRLPG